METKTKLAMAAAVGAASLIALNAYAQAQDNQPAHPPAVSAPAAKDAGAAQGGSTGQAGEKAANKAEAEAGPADRSAMRDGYRRRWSRWEGRSQWRGHMGRRGFMGQRGPRWRNMSETDRQAFFEARIAAIRAGLMLNETQARLWPNVEAAMRDMFAKRRQSADRIRKEGRPANPFDRMKRRGEIMAERGAALQKLANAAKPLYDTLSDDQKRRLRVLTHGFGRRGGMMPRRGMGYRHPGMHRGIRGGMRGGMRGGIPGHRWQRHGQFHQNWRNSHADRMDFRQGRRQRQSFDQGSAAGRHNGVTTGQRL